MRYYKLILYLIFFSFVFLPGIPHLYGDATIRAFDTPNDDGSSITVKWNYTGTGDTFELFRKTVSDTNWQKLKTLPLSKHSYLDDNTVRGVQYQYGIRIKTDTILSEMVISKPVSAKAQFFDTGKTLILVLILGYFAILLYFIGAAKKGKSLFIRKIAGLDALDEAVGRATEMGKPILFIPGISSMSDIATIAAVNILGPVAKKVAEYGTDLLVPNRDPIVASVTQEVVKESYIEAGRPDLFNPNKVWFVTQSQFAYAAAVQGIMVRERPATILLLGMFYAESLLLAETGNSTGAIQIAGTDAVDQLPFFITSCDYTIMGEELYAAGAYLSKEPTLLSSIKAQDYGKIAIFATLLLGLILGLLKSNWLINILTVR
ncbi:fibronectin type III domain-containing protein [candidate division WOR-3 bacterium]|nr:fibronectin type III domain-containing protein [candidate division WOR-3 bacterium]